MTTVQIFQSISQNLLIIIIIEKFIARKYLYEYNETREKKFAFYCVLFDSLQVKKAAF